MTHEFLELKGRYFGRPPRYLDGVLREVKGSDLRSRIRSGSHRDRRRATQFMHSLLRLLEVTDASVVGRVWIKALRRRIDADAVTTSSMQAISATFQNLLEVGDDVGLVVIDSSTPNINATVSHSIFTQKFQQAGDAYDRLVELPTFGHSKNHVGLQIADILVSGFVAPMAGAAFCVGHVAGVHVHPHYSDIRARFGGRIERLQHRYRDEHGAWRGGFTTHDGLGGQPGRFLFRT